MNRLTGRQIFKIAGYSGFFIVVFLLFFIASFPIERFGRAIEQQLGAALGREVIIGETDLSLTGALVLSNVEIGAPAVEEQAVQAAADSQATKDGKKKKPAKKRRLMYFFDEISLDLGVLALAFDDLQLAVDMEGLGGSLHFEFEGPLSFFTEPETPPKRMQVTKAKGADDEENDDSPIHLALEVEGVLLERMLDLKTLLPFPASGSFNLKVELESPSSKFAESTGVLALSLRSVVLSKKGFESEVFGMNLAVPPIVIQSLDSEMAFEKGVGRVSNFDMISKHVDVKIQGGMTLRDPLPKSQMDLYLMFKPLPAYIEKSNILKTLMPDIDTLSRDAKKAHRADGYFGFRYTGGMDKSGRFTAAKKYTPRGSRQARAGRSKRSRSRARPPRRARTPRKKAADTPAISPPPRIGKSAGGDTPRPAAAQPEPPVQGQREPANIPSAVEMRISKERAAREKRLSAAAAKEEAVEEPAEEEIEEEVEEVEEEAEAEAEEIEEVEEPEASEKEEAVEQE